MREDMCLVVLKSRKELVGAGLQLPLGCLTRGTHTLTAWLIDSLRAVEQGQATPTGLEMEQGRNQVQSSCLWVEKPLHSDFPPHSQLGEANLLQVQGEAWAISGEKSQLCMGWGVPSRRHCLWSPESSGKEEDIMGEGQRKVSLGKGLGTENG
jgi:hypothetical protein